jgi:hypothetical protein
MKLEFSRQIFERFSNFTKIGPVGVELFHADGRTDMTKQIVAFRNFANAPKRIVTFLIIPVTDIFISDIFVHTEVCEVATAITCL